MQTGTVTAKLFEWHRVRQDLKAVRAQLAQAMGHPEAQARMDELHARLVQLEAGASELLADIDRLRAGPSTK